MRAPERQMKIFRLENFFKKKKKKKLFSPRLVFTNGSDDCSLSRFTGGMSCCGSFFRSEAEQHLSASFAVGPLIGKYSDRSSFVSFFFGLK